MQASVHPSRWCPDPPRHNLDQRLGYDHGRRDELADILIEAVGDLPGCLSYVVARDTEDPNAIWVTEVWESRASHQASLETPSVQQAIAKGRPLIEGFRERFETTPLGGQGLE